MKFSSEPKLHLIFITPFQKERNVSDKQGAID